MEEVVENQNIYNYPEVNDFASTEDWQHAYNEYYNSIKVDASGEPLIEEYLQVLDSITLNH